MQPTSNRPSFLDDHNIKQSKAESPKAQTLIKIKALIIGTGAGIGLALGVGIGSALGAGFLSILTLGVILPISGFSGGLAGTFISYELTNIAEKVCFKANDVLNNQGSKET